jgi:uncharacterized protein YciI
MLFFVHCVDKPGHGQVRTDTRPAHLAYIEGFADRLFAGGALLADDAATPLGSLIIIDLPDRAAVEAFTANDPYNKAGLFASVTIQPWRKVFPKT